MDAADLRDWAIENEINENVFEFLLKYGSLSDHGFIYADLPIWKKVSDALNDENLDHDETLATITKLLGEVGATHFNSFMPDMSYVATRILNGEGYEIDLQNDWSLATDIGSYLVTELSHRINYIKTSWGSDFKSSDAYRDWLAQVDSALTFMHITAPIEASIMFVKNITALPALLSHEIPNLLGLLDMYADILSA